MCNMFRVADRWMGGPMTYPLRGGVLGEPGELGLVEAVAHQDEQQLQLVLVHALGRQRTKGGGGDGVASTRT